MLLSRPIEPPDTRRRSPSGGSTLITSAPMSARCCVANGPSSTAVRSITRTPSSGPGIFPSFELFLARTMARSFRLSTQRVARYPRSGRSSLHCAPVHDSAVAVRQRTSTLWPPAVAWGMLRPIMMRPPFRPTDEMLCLRRFKSLVGQTVTVAPRGPLGLGWRPYYTRQIHANGHQQRQRELAFVAVRGFLQRRLKTSCRRIAADQDAP